MKIALGYDPHAARVKQNILEICGRLGCEVTDFGGSDPIYANTAIAVSEYVAAGKADKGVLVCGTGIGMSIAANKVKGIRAALVTDAYSAERAVLSNDANIICFGAFTLGEKVIENLLSIWLSLEFDENSSSAVKVARIAEYDKKRWEGCR